jgi:hypothetical protein
MLREDTQDHPAVRDLRPGVDRSLLRPEASGLRTDLVRKMRRAERRTQAGLYLGTGVTVDVDLARLDRVVARTVAGLYFRHFGKRVKPGRDVHAHNMSGFQEGANLEYLREMLQLTAEGDEHRIGDVLRYRFRATVDEPDVMSWALLFYERVGFIAFVAPEEVSRRRELW